MQGPLLGNCLHLLLPCPEPLPLRGHLLPDCPLHHLPLSPLDLEHLQLPHQLIVHLLVVLLILLRTLLSLVALTPQMTQVLLRRLAVSESLRKLSLVLLQVTLGHLRESLKFRGPLHQRRLLPDLPERLLDLLSNRRHLLEPLRAQPHLLLHELDLLAPQVSLSQHLLVFTFRHHQSNSLFVCKFKGLGLAGQGIKFIEQLRLLLSECVEGEVEDGQLGERVLEGQRVLGQLELEVLVVLEAVGTGLVQCQFLLYELVHFLSLVLQDYLVF